LRICFIVSLYKNITLALLSLKSFHLSNWSLETSYLTLFSYCLKLIIYIDCASLTMPLHKDLTLFKPNCF
jgi:hypothetical protein